MADGIHRVHRGECWGIYAFDPGYSEDLLKRLDPKVTNATLEHSEIKLSLDNSNQQISIVIEEQTALAFSRCVSGARWSRSQTADKRRERGTVLRAGK